MASNGQTNEHAYLRLFVLVFLFCCAVHLQMAIRQETSEDVGKRRSMGRVIASRSLQGWSQAVTTLVITFEITVCDLKSFCGHCQVSCECRTNALHSTSLRASKTLKFSADSACRAVGKKLQN